MIKLSLQIIIMLFSTINVFSQWIECNNGLKSKFINSLEESNNEIFAGTSRGGIYYSSNDGESWLPKNYGLTDSSIVSIAISDSNIVVGSYLKGIFISSNKGDSWQVKNNGLKEMDIRSLAINGNNIFAGTSNGIFVSNDCGNSWSEGNTLLSKLVVYSLAIYHNDIFAGTNKGLLKSSDNGSNWFEQNTGILSGTQVISVAIKENLIIAGTINIPKTLSGVIISTDNGINWDIKNNGLYLSIFNISDTIIFAGSWGNGVFISLDNGNSWIAKNNGLTNKQIYSLVTVADNIFAGTLGNGVLKSKISDLLTKVEVENKIRWKHQLNISPNPVSENLFISSEGANFKKIVITNNLGVSVLQAETSENEIELNTSSLPPGVYFCTLRYGNYIETKKFVIVR